MMAWALPLQDKQTANFLSSVIFNPAAKPFEGLPQGLTNQAVRGRSKRNECLGIALSRLVGCSRDREKVHPEN